MVVIASKGGSPHHPAWYHNLKANPLVRTQYRDHDEQRAAREVDGEDRERLFSMMAAQFPNFTAYQERAAHDPRDGAFQDLTRRRQTNRKAD